MKSHTAEFFKSKRDRIVLNVVLAQVPIVGVIGALCGHLVVGLTIAGVAAALCAAGYASARGTRLFRVYAGALLMVDSAALIAASGDQTVMHLHVFIVMTFLLLYFDWLPIVVATVTIVLHHAVGSLLFPQLVFREAQTYRRSFR